MTFSIVARSADAQLYGVAVASKFLAAGAVVPAAVEVAALLTAAGHPPGDARLDVALAAWAGVENLEERLVPGRIDPLVLAHLRASR